MAGGPALSSGVNAESQMGSPLRPSSGPPCQGRAPTLQAGLTQRPREGLHTDTGHGYVSARPWGSLPCSQEGNTGGKKGPFCLQFCCIPLDMKLEALWLACYTPKAKESQRIQRLKLSHLEPPSFCACLLHERIHFLLAEVNTIGCFCYQQPAKTCFNKWLLIFF